MLTLYINKDNFGDVITKRTIKTLLLSFVLLNILVSYAIAADEGVKKYDANGNEVPVYGVPTGGSVNYNTNTGNDAQSSYNSGGDEGISDLIPSLNGGVNALKTNWSPIYDYLKSLSWGSVGLAVGVGVIAIAWGYTKVSAGTIANKIKWITSGQNGMIVPGILLLALIIYMSVIKFVATWNS